MTANILAEVADERTRQNEKWGEQNHIDGTGPRVPYAGRLCYMEDAARDARLRCQSNGPGRRTPDNWRDILLEEVFEAFAEDDPAKLRRELVQVAAVAVQWVECIDRRTAVDLLPDHVLAAAISDEYTPPTGPILTNEQAQVLVVMASLVLGDREFFGATFDGREWATAQRAVARLKAAHKLT